MKPVSLNQLLFHTKCDTLSFYRPPGLEDVDGLLSDMRSQLELEGKNALGELLEKNRPEIKKIIKGHPKKSHGFFLSGELTGYVIIEHEVEAFSITGTTFHLRPLLEELFTNPEFMVVNVSLYDIKVYRGDFQHIEIVQHYEFDQLPKGLMESQKAGFYTPQYLGLLPFKTLQALKTIAHKIQDMVLYNSLPVIVTGLHEVRDIFLRYFNQVGGLITDVQEDFYEQTCVQVAQRCRSFHHLVLDFYSAQLQERLKRVIKSKKLLTDLSEIIRSVHEGKVVHLVLPLGGKLWGTFDLSQGTYDIHKKMNRNSSVDILSGLADEVIRQGGKIQFLRPHFFPQDSHVLAILKG